MILKTQKRRNILDTNELESVIAQVGKILSESIHEAELGKNNAVNLQDPRYLVNNLSETFQNEGIFAFFKQYLKYATRLHSPKFIGHQTAKPTVESILSDLVCGATNNSTAAMDMGLPGIAMELNVISELSKLIGYNPEHSGGILTHGGSLANFTALLTAREKMDPGSWENGVTPNLVGLVPKVAHYCVTRVFSMMGLGSKSVIEVPTDPQGRILIPDLQFKIAEVKEKGLKPFVIVGTLGSTPTGYFDDFEELGKVAKENNIWLHADGAHGASAMFSDKHKHLCKGAQNADSVVWDFHKLGGTSSLCTALVYKDKQNGTKTFKQDASYLAKQKAGEHQRIDLFPYTVECTKPAISLKAFLSIQQPDKRREFIDTVFSKAQDFASKIESKSNFTIPFMPQSNIILFQYTRVNNSEQNDIYQRIIQDGEFHISFTKWKNRDYLRLTVMNPLTEWEHVEKLLNRIEDEFVSR